MAKQIIVSKEGFFFKEHELETENCIITAVCFGIGKVNAGLDGVQIKEGSEGIYVIKDLREDVLTDSYNSLPILSSPSRLLMYLL